MSQTFKKPDFDKAPASAFCFAVPVESLESEPEVLLKSSGVIEHGYWGRIVHDLAGMKAPADRYVLDYCHDDNQVLGYVDNLRIVPEGLLVTPHLLPGEGSQDRAAEILRLSKGGTPYQASLDWRGPASLEWVDPDVSVEVNGGTFEGPGIVVRQWVMTGAAICPHGADPNTYAKFSRGEATRVVEIPRVDPKQLSKAVEPKPTPPKTMSQTETPAAPDFRQLFTKFSKAFGAEKGLQLLDAGTSYEAALETELADVKKAFASQADATKKAHDDAVQKLTAELDEAKKQLAAAKKQFGGEETPIPTSEDESGDKKTFTGKPGENPMRQFVRFRDGK